MEITIEQLEKIYEDDEPVGLPFTRKLDELDVKIEEKNKTGRKPNSEYAELAEYVLGEYRFKSITTTEMARIMGCKYTYVGTRVKRLRAHLERRGYTVIYDRPNMLYRLEKYGPRD